MSSKLAGWWLVLAFPLGCGPIGGEVVDIYDGQGSASSGSTSSGSESGDRGGSTLADGSGSATAPDGSTGVVTQGGTTQGVEPDTSTGHASATSESTGAGSSSGGPETTTTGSSPSCDEIFGAAPGYVLCMESETECRFNADIAGTNCTNICSMFGGVCTGAFNNPPDAGMECIANFAEDCGVTHMDEICVCDK